MEKNNTFLDSVENQLECLTQMVGEVLLIEELFVIVMFPPCLKSDGTQEMKVEVEQGQYSSTRIPTNVLGSGIFRVICIVKKQQLLSRVNR